MTIDLKNLTIQNTHEALVRGDFTVRELVEAYLNVIQSRDGDIHAYLEVYADALQQADLAQEIIKSGKSTLLTGIPFALKDNILLKGKIASSGSKMLENYHATYDATAVARLKKEGAVFIGRTNMDEFAMGGSTENSAYGATKNPHDITRVPGGTSGGSAAAVAADMALVALGSDTGGSIRQPASFCGLVGLKPTYGGVSRYGLMAAVSSFDQIGPITKTVTDAEIIFTAIHGKDEHDGTSISETTYTPQRVGKTKPVIGVPYEFLKANSGSEGESGIDRDVLENFNQSIEHFKKLGFEVKDISLPNISNCLPVYYILNFAEVSSNLARYDGVKYGFNKEGKDFKDEYFKTRAAGFGTEARRRILLGTYVLSSGYYDAYYNKANAARTLITNDFHTAFEKVDIIITPTTPAPAFKIGEKVSNPLAMYLEDIFTVTPNLIGMPAMSIPSGFSEIEGKKLPLGIQMVARHGDEKTLFEAGKIFLGEK
ncbi:MAG: Asp-tRNA(Asn)/Glu-tRNA(Gln) amidotransferase subunit GatA [Candidatus Taylorbacteria bacterium]|nr:Asp-tRNA(Asn)/Glu-tRNA(Gln) amidotransferase subunit GatA [Candidatus Taylorbacteria bacterium]